AQYLIQGNITSMQGVKKTDSKGKTYYQGSVSYTLKIVDPSNGTLKGTQTFTHEGLTGNIGDTPDEAIIKTLDYVVISMDDFVDEYFKMKGTIVQIESTKKDKAQTVYIDLGTKRGVQKGQKFIVYIEMDIAGELSLKEVGRLNVKEVLSGTRSLCTVSKGGEEIMKASKEEKKLIILSRKNTFLGGLGL
ncbi:penicillin-binding protein activator LpoB, partial [Bacteroides xylanisolvens]